VRLRSITLTNFRQFKGGQHLDLATEPGKGTVLIFGANGSGKTTFLNAFTWALYGELTADLERPEEMITKSVWRAAAPGLEVPISVEIEFEHHGRIYRVRRSAAVRKDTDAQPPLAPSVKMWVTEPDGSSIEVPAAQDRISTILPKRLSRFFFFNGERIEKLAKRGAYGEVREDIKILLNISPVERALNHLPKVDRKLGADLRRYGGDRVAQIQSAIDTLDDEVQLLEAELARQRAALRSLEEERAEVRRLLAEHDEAAPLQRERESVEGDLAAAKEGLRAAEEKKRALIASRGFIAFTGDIASRTREVASALFERGALPAPLKRDFVEKLLNEDHRCICGTDLIEGTTAWQRVSDWRARAGLAAVEASWQRLDGEAAALSKHRMELRSELAEAAANVDAARERRDRLEEKRAELAAKLDQIPLEDVNRLRSKETDLDARIATANRDIGSIEVSLKDKVRERDSRRGEMEAAEVKDGLADLARRRQSLVREVSSALEEILSIRTDAMRQRLDAEVRDVFSSVTAKPFSPYLDENLDLGLYEDFNGERHPVARSTGENQILSMSFVAAVSKLARETRPAAEGELPEDAGLYPIVIDAAFGSLDINYQRDISLALGRLAPQLIVLVSKSQGLGEVVDQLRPHTGRTGIFVTHSTKSAAIRPSEEIILNGTTYPYLTTGAEQDWAQIVEAN
jgi:DNA sulfur modification protein DndD